MQLKDGSQVLTLVLSFLCYFECGSRFILYLVLPVLYLNFKFSFIIYDRLHVLIIRLLW